MKINKKKMKIVKMSNMSSFERDISITINECEKFKYSSEDRELFENFDESIFNFKNNYFDDEVYRQT